MKFLKLDTNIIPIKTRSIKEFNDYVEKYKTENEIFLTKSNNISQHTLRNLPASKTWKRGNTMEFHYIDGKQHIRIQYAVRYDGKNDHEVGIGRRAWNYFQPIQQFIPTDDKEEEPEFFTCPENRLAAYYNYINERYKEFTIEDTYSLDRNSSFAASMAELYPETAEFINEYYQKRRFMEKTDERRNYGSVFIGYMKREHREKAWKKIVSHSNRKVHELRLQLEAQGHEILIVNTDAVKFIGKPDYTESKELGGFKFEWQGEQMYMKGVKNYTYTKDGKREFKIAGSTKLDRIKPRSEWTFEDYLYKDNVKVLKTIIKENGTLEQIEDEN